MRWEPCAEMPPHVIDAICTVQFQIRNERTDNLRIPVLRTPINGQSQSARQQLPLCGAQASEASANIIMPVHLTAFTTTIEFDHHVSCVVCGTSSFSTCMDTVLKYLKRLR